jgi:hypothetical protein
MIILSGCTTTRIVGYDEATMAKITERIEGENVALVMRDDEGLEVREVAVASCGATGRSSC